MLQIVSHLQIVAAKSGKILHQNTSHFPCFDLCHHLLELGTVKIRTRKSVIHKFPNGKARQILMFLHILPQQ